MSQLTENTLLVKVKDCPKLLAEFDGKALQRVYSDNNVAAYVFDFNGDGFAHIIDDCGITPLIVETYYGKRDKITYRYDKKADGLLGSRYYFRHLVKKYIKDEKELNRVLKDIQYGI